MSRPHAAPWLTLPLSMISGFTLACASADRSSEPSPAPPAEQEAYGGFVGDKMASDDAESAAQSPRKARAKDAAAEERPAAPSAAAPAANRGEGDGLNGGDAPSALEDGSAAQEAPATRAWFPETFLWLPSVRTGADGLAQVSMRMPDRLTGWRVLGLAHTMDGAQAGSVTRVQTALPVYVDLVVPPALRLGDEVELPLQAVNTTSSSFDGELSLWVGADSVSQGRSRLLLPPNADLIRPWRVGAAALGPLQLRAGFRADGVEDSVEQTIFVEPVGHPVFERRRGGLSAPREFTFDPPPSSSPASDRLRLSFFPGALSVLRAELGGGRARSGLVGAAYGLQLSGDALRLLEQLGAPPAPDGPDRAALDDRLRRLRLLSAQRAFSAPLTGGIDSAAPLMVAALRHPDDLALLGLGERLAAQLVAEQSPDGTYISASAGVVSLDSGLRTLATAASALQRAARAPGLGPETTAELERAALRVRVLGEGAAERLFNEVRSPATLAALLSADLLSGHQRDEAVVSLKAAIVVGEDGVAKIHQRSDEGAVPMRPLRAAALGALALHRHGEAADAQRLGEAVLSGWSPATSWGHAEDDLLALEVIDALYKGGLPPAVTLRLERDGAVLWSDTLDAARLGELTVADLPAPGPGGPLRLVAEPPLPGAGFEAELRTMTPWTVSPSNGLELKLSQPDRPRVGQPSLVELSLAAPIGAAPSLRWSLPTGVVADAERLEALVASGELRSFHQEDGQLTLDLPAKSETLRQLPVTLRPAFAGRLQSGAIHGSVGGVELVLVAPTTWVIAAR